MKTSRSTKLTNLIVLGLLGALATGVAIGMQSTISSRVGSLIGSFKAGVMINFVGGILAALIFTALLIIKGRGYWQFSGSAGWYIAAAGALGIVIITGIAYSLRLTGVAAGLSAVILGTIGCFCDRGYEGIRRITRSNSDQLDENHWPGGDRCWRFPVAAQEIVGERTDSITNDS